VNTKSISNISKEELEKRLVALVDNYSELYSEVVIGINNDSVHLSPKGFKFLVVNDSIQNVSIEGGEYIELSGKSESGLNIFCLI